MRALTLSRVVAVLAGLTIAGACTDSTAPRDPATPIEGPIDGTFMTLAPTSATISPGQTVMLHAQLHQRLGTPLQGVTITWRSHNESVASVSDGGVVQAKAEGHAVIVASAHGRSQTATVNVRRPGPKEPIPSMDPARWTP
jgi:uncharacterized protein YjdB